MIIAPGSHWENGFVEFSKDKMRDESLNLEIFYSMKEVQVMLVVRIEYNTIRPLRGLMV